MLLNNTWNFHFSRTNNEYFLSQGLWNFCSFRSSLVDCAPCAVPCASSSASPLVICSCCCSLCSSHWLGWIVNMRGLSLKWCMFFLWWHLNKLGSIADLNNNDSRAVHTSSTPRVGFPIDTSCMGHISCCSCHWPVLIEPVMVTWRLLRSMCRVKKNTLIFWIKEKTEDESCSLRTEKKFVRPKGRICWMIFAYFKKFMRLRHRTRR